MISTPASITGTIFFLLGFFMVLLGEEVMMRIIGTIILVVLSIIVTTTVVNQEGRVSYRSFEERTVYKKIAVVQIEEKVFAILAKNPNGVVVAGLAQNDPPENFVYKGSGVLGDPFIRDQKK
ncbi:MAG: hypothetical protein Q7S34_01555 [bacterium]|nr:hypothetical protein [bacterium]